MWGFTDTAFDLATAPTHSIHMLFVASGFYNHGFQRCHDPTACTAAEYAVSGAEYPQGGYVCAQEHPAVRTWIDGLCGVMWCPYSCCLAAGHERKARVCHDSSVHCAQPSQDHPTWLATSSSAVLQEPREGRLGAGSFVCGVAVAQDDVCVAFDSVYCVFAFCVSACRVRGLCLQRKSEHRSRR